MTTNGTTLRRLFENLKLRHYVYLLMLGWEMHELGDSSAFALQLPESVTSRKTDEFTHD